ncbi:glycosyltransferase [Pseudolysobacter antarcticus]|nr:glycosyltransferase [Pseudolysobacter antarcticus]
MAKERTAIIVAGMHRSGTSVATRIINLLGAELAGDLIPAGIGNERGHWESSTLQSLHNRLLAELESDIYSPVNIAPDWFGSAAAQAWIGRMQELLEVDYPTSTFFVLKDPRMTLVLPLWLEAMRKSSIVPRFVLPFRHPDAVAASLELRERRLDSGNALPHAQGVAVWLRYVLAAEKFSRGYARSFVAFDDVLADWRVQFARIGRQLGIEWPQWQRAQKQIDDFLEGDGRVHEIESSVNGGGEISREVYASMQRAVLDPDVVYPLFNGAANTIATAEALLSAYVVAREHVFGDLRRQADAASRQYAIERADMHRRFETELDARDVRVTDATKHARRLEETIGMLERERSNAVECAKSLEQDRDRAVEHARSLQLSRDEAVEYARSLEQARNEVAPPEESESPARNEIPVFFTIASRNYLAYALTLMQSIAVQYPNALRYLILADRDAADPTLVGAPFTTILTEALALPDFEAFAFRYTIMEFNTAIKPYAFAHLRRLHPGAGIIYLDPDILVIAPLTEVEAALAQGTLVVLTPHLLEPIDDDRHPGEREILASGTYNCGFVAIGAHAEADRLITWWANRLEFGAFSDITAGLFTDQKWIDLVPGLFADVHILRDQGYNLAYWNLSQRPVSRRELAWYADEQPLAFVHFSGVDLDHPAQFSKHQNRHTQATLGELEPLYADYLSRLTANGHAEHRAKPYAFGSFADGEPICEPVRAVYRRYFDKGAAQPQRHPFLMDRSLYDLLCDELPECADAPITRVMYATWKMRVDVQHAFDLNEAEGRDGFMRWFVSTAGPEMGIPQRHLDPVHRALTEHQEDDAPDPKPSISLPEPEPMPVPVRGTGSVLLDLINWSCRFRLALRLYAMIPERARHWVRHWLERIAGSTTTVAPTLSSQIQSGINLVGYAHGEFGVAEILRRYAHALHDGGVPFVVRNFDIGVPSRESDRSMQRFLSEECRYEVNLFCINADQMPVAREQMGDAVFAGRYNIGCWFWELEKFPEEWHGAIDLVDEIWVTSPFVRDAIAACTPKPVHIVPVALEVNLSRSYSRGEFGLAEGAFVCLFSFDFNSYTTRKNAEGAIAAFRRAFADGRRDVRLLIKTINGERHADALRELTDAAAGDDRIEVRDGFLDRIEMWGLQACCDCYISLHRSEGLGLGMAECMLFGKPVVATAYSGNLAFMDADNSCLVGYSLVPVEEGDYPAWQGQHWAEPDIDQAAGYLKRLADDPAYARQIGEKAKASVRQRFSAASSLAAITARLVEINSRSI